MNGIIHFELGCAYCTTCKACVKFKACYNCDMWVHVECHKCEKITDPAQAARDKAHTASHWAKLEGKKVKAK